MYILTWLISLASSKFILDRFKNSKEMKLQWNLETLIKSERFRLIRMQYFLFIQQFEKRNKWTKIRFVNFVVKVKDH